ncbi:MAG: universal stress protein [Cecembia sp.]
MEQLLKIYVMVDFSDYTESTLKMVKDWVAGKNAEIKVLHQLDFHLPTLANHDLRLKLLYDHKRELLNRWFKLSEEIFGSSDAVSFEILEVPILEYLKKTDQDAMIFMGLKGGGILKQIFLGSMVSEVIERLNHTTIAVPKTLKKQVAFDKLVVTAHPKFGFNEEAFGRLMRCLPSSVRSIHWVGIAREGDDEDALYDYLRMLSIMHAHDLNTEISVFIGAEVFSKVKSFFIENGNQVLLIQKGGRTFQDKIFRKFLVNDLVFDGSIPLIVLPLK